MKSGLPLEDSLKLELGMAVGCLENGKWRRIGANVSTSLDQMNALFEARFETEQ
jgi:hypothetical protein